jgi:ribosomal-protein-alanine N-acetyltransferase
MGEKDVLRYFPKQDPPSRDRVQKIVSSQLGHWAEHGYGWWAVVPRGEIELIGWAGLQYLPETDEIEVAYLLGKPHWGRGLGTEAARASLNFGFDELGLACVVGIVHPENTASQRVLEKLGMSLVERTHYFGMDCYRYTIKADGKHG